jgi:hypothetical protein
LSQAPLDPQTGERSAHSLALTGSKPAEAAGAQVRGCQVVLAFKIRLSAAASREKRREKKKEERRRGKEESG